MRSRPNVKLPHTPDSIIGYVGTFIHGTMIRWGMIAWDYDHMGYDYMVV